MDLLSFQAITRKQKRLSVLYPNGTKIKLTHPIHKITEAYEGLTGTVSSVDENGMLIVRWDNSANFAVNPLVDSITILNRKASKSHK